MHGIDVTLRSRYLQFVFWRLIFARFQRKHFHLFFERQFLWHRVTGLLLLLLLLLLESTRSRISAKDRMCVRNAPANAAHLIQSYLPVNLLGANDTRRLLYARIP